MELQVFENSEFGKVRTVMIEGVPWLVGRDVALALGYRNINRDIHRHVEEEDRLLLNETQYRNGIEFDFKELGQRGGWIVNESGLYAMIMGSKLPTAKSFKRWITSDVLPTIRHTGAYLTPKLKAEIEIYKAKADYLDHLLGQEDSEGVRITSKILRIPERLFTKTLEDMNFAYRISAGAPLLPKSTASKNGYAFVVPAIDKQGKTHGVHMKITPLGRFWLFTKLRETFALPYSATECLSLENIEKIKGANK